MLLFKRHLAIESVTAHRRFSEDIDLAVDYRLLGFVGKRDPKAKVFPERADQLLSEMLEVCAASSGRSLSICFVPGVARFSGTKAGFVHR